MKVLEYEYTDTFAGEANYSWVERVRLEFKDSTSDLAVIRRAKSELGLQGVRGRMHRLGDGWEFRPYGSCTVAFFIWRH